MRRRLGAPSWVQGVDVAPPGSRAALMRACRSTLSLAGCDDVLVAAGWRRRATGAAAASMLTQAEVHADRDDYWWPGIVCWSAADGTRVVYTDDGRPRDGAGDGALGFIGWGPRTEEVLRALGRLGRPGGSASG